MRHRSMGDAVCPIARSLDTIGEWCMVGIVQSYENFGLRKTYSAAILPSRTMMTSSPV